MYQGLAMEHVGGRQKLTVSLALAVVFLLALWVYPLLIPIGIGFVVAHDIASKLHLRSGGWWLMGMMMVVALGCAGMVRVLQMDDGPWLFLGLALIVSMTDASAQVIGRRFGVPGTFMPKYSPNKSLAGVHGSWVVGGATACASIGLFWLFAVDLSASLVLAIVASPVVSTYGDILESAVKRAIGVKDFGSYLGRSTGALLDRVDSWVAVFAVAFVVLSMP